MKTNFKKVFDFNLVMKQHIGSKPGIPDKNVRKLAKRLIKEESKELMGAFQKKDLVNIAKELSDLLYVVYGAATKYGIDIDSVFDIVHESNMKKIGGSVREDGKREKPIGWVNPNELIKKELKRQEEKHYKIFDVEYL